MTDYEKNTILENWYSAQQLPFSLPDRISTQYHLLSVLKKTENDYTCILTSLKNGNLYILKCCQTAPLNIARHEYEILQKLRAKKTPNSIYIPYSLEYFEENDLAYLLRDYLYGCSFREYVAFSPSDSLPEKDLLKCGLQLCDALEFLHSQNPPIIHRDIKPDNVIFDQYGNYRLIDFGIARYYRREKSCDTANMGSENSAAPEQFGYSQTDARTDIYSLGSLLLYGATCEYDIQKLEFSDISDGMKHIIRKCMQFAPNDRYQTASALRKDLQKHENLMLLRQKRRWFLGGVLCGAAIWAVVSGCIFYLSSSSGQNIPASFSMRDQNTDIVSETENS